MTAPAKAKRRRGFTRLSRLDASVVVAASSPTDVHHTACSEALRVVG